MCLLMVSSIISHLMDRISPVEYRTLQRVIHDPRAEELPQKKLRKIIETLENNRIQGYEIPSEHPGDLRGNTHPGNPGATPKQLDIQRRFETGKYRLIAASGANRSGKTVSTFNLCFAKHLRDRAQDGDMYWVIAPDFQSHVKGPMRWMWECLPKFMFGNRTYNYGNGFGVQKMMTLTLPDQRGKCAVHYKTSEQAHQTYEMVPIHGVYWTEADREFLLDALIARTADFRGFILIDYVPTEFWHRDRIKLNNDPVWFHARFAMAENAHNLPSGEIEYQRRLMGEREWKVRGLGEERGSFGVVYTEYDEDVHFIKPFAIPDDWPRWRSIDYGGSAPTACIWGTIVPIGFELNGTPTDQERLLVYREYYQMGMNVRYHAENIIALSGTNVYRNPVFIDPHAYDKNPGNERTIAEQYRASGLPCRPWPRATSRESKAAQVNMVKLRLEDRTLLVFDTCVNINKEFQTWRYKVDAEGNPDERDVYEKKNDHALDAIAGWVASRPVSAHHSPTVVYTGEDEHGVEPYELEETV